MSLPPSYEQKKIAAVLSTVQRAIEAQDRIIATTTELKKALMQKLFTEGLHGEPQKQTEIGPVPESWEVVELKHLLYQLDYGTSEKCTYQSDGPPVLRIPNVLSGEIDTKDLKYGPLKLVSSEGLYLKAGDLLFVRTNGVRENAGRCAEYEQSELGAQFASYLIRARVDQQQIEPRFVMEYTRTLKGRSYLSGRAVRTADGKFNVNKGIIETVPVPVPSVGDQKRIVHLARTLDERTRQAREKHIVLAELFNTLLHQLMTAQVRVNDIDLSFLDDLSTDDTARREEAG
jgi:type I restriction enzyme S subunit